MVESFSASLLPALKSYWAESHLVFCQTLTTELFYKSMWSTLRLTGLIVVVLMIFTCGELVLVLWGVVQFEGIGVQFRDKIV